MFLNEDDPFYEAKSKVLTVNNQPPSQLYYLRYESIPSDLLRALRVQLLKPSELDFYGKIFEGKRVSLENELDVLRQLVAACDTLLKQYPQTAIEDQKVIQDAEQFGALSERYVLCQPACAAACAFCLMMKTHVWPFAVLLSAGLRRR